MDIVKWQSILIEWVNCLNLSKPVNAIEDLKDGEFFKHLLVHMSKNDETKTQISDFLKKHYPAFFLENESADIQDSVEITYAYTLLLHYCSLIDCREEFILPLCKDLTYMSQVFVRNFLEDLQLNPVITRDVLKSAIFKMNKFDSTPTKSVSFNSSPTNTPLLDYLKTPYKQKNAEHKREIKQLQAQIDFERFEKADLQEELSIQYEKNNKLERNICENQNEIRRLRGIVGCLEGGVKTPPLNSKQDGHVENKQLRDEIVTLEKCVENLYKEQEVLQTERDKARYKLRKMEENNNEWQHKYIINEKQNMKLTEENKSYVQELFYYRERCEELQTMLHELNPRKRDESYDDSFYNKSSSIDTETLAQTVVDVQLVDAQQENKKLNNQLSELEQKISKLTIQLNHMECQINKLNETNQIRQDELNEKNVQLKIKTEEIYILNQKTLDTTNIINKLNAEINNNNEQINTYLNKFKIDLNYDEDFPPDSNLINKLATLLQVFETQKHNNTRKIFDLQESCQSLSLQILTLNDEVVTLNLNEVETKREINDLKINLKQAENKIEHYEKQVVTNYENLIEKYKTIIEEKCAMISELTKLKDVLINKDNNIIKLQDDLKTEQTNYCILEETTLSLKNIIKEKDGFIKSLETEKQTINNQLSQEKQLKEDLNNDLKHVQQELTNEKSLKDDLNNQFISTKQILCEKINEIESLQMEINNLNINIETINSEVLCVKGKLNAETENVKNKEKSVEDLNIHLFDLKNQLSQTCDEKVEMMEEVKQLKQQLNEYKNEFETYKTEMEIVFDEIDLMQNCDEFLKEAHNKEQEKNMEILENMLPKINKLKQNITNLVQENHRVTCEINALQKQYIILNDLKTDLEMKSLDSTNKITELNDDIENLQNKNEQYCSSLETYRNNFNKTSETLLETQISIEGLIKKHKMEIENYRDSILELQKQNSHLQKEVFELKKSEKTLTDEMFAQRSKLKNVLQDYDTTVKLNEDISKKLSSNNEQLSRTSLDLETSLREIEMYKSLKAEFEKSFTTLTKDHETKTLKLKQKNDNLKKEMEVLINEMSKKTDELKVEKTKQHDWNIRLNKYTLETEKLEEKVLNLTDKLHMIEDEKQKIIIYHEEYKSETDIMIEKTKQSHEQEILELNVIIEKDKKKIQTLKIDYEKLRDEHHHLQKILENLQEDKNVLTMKTEQLNEDLIKLKSCSDANYKEKLDEINDTKTKLSYIYSLIENIYGLFENELNKFETDEENLCYKIQNDIIIIKTKIEQLLEKKNKLQNDLDDISKHASSLEQINNEEKIKFNQIKIENERLNEQLEKQQQIYHEEVNDLNLKLNDKIDEIKIVGIEKQNLIKEYRMIQNKVSLLRKSRDELAETHQKIIKEVEVYIIRTHDSVDVIRKDFTKRLEEHEKSHNSDLELIKQLENFLEVEQKNATFLQNRVTDLTSEKQQLINITSKSFGNIHNLYNIIFGETDITEQINKLKHNQSEIQDELQSVTYEHEIVAKEIELIESEFIDLKKLREELLNYELIKSDYNTLKNKYNLMSVCETENNGYKLKICDMEMKLSDLQKENIKYQKEISEIQAEHKKEKYKMLTEQNSTKIDKDLYTKLLGENTRLQMDYLALKKISEERNHQLSELSCVKESYEKLLEDNNKSVMELDTLQYKRNRDKEEFKRLLEEQKTKGEGKITDLRNEYDEKLRKMKQKMVDLYKKEIEGEKKRFTTKLSQSEEIIQSLKSQLWVTGNKNVELSQEVERLRFQQQKLKEQRRDDERRISTLPRDTRFLRPPQIDEIEETVTVSRKRRSINHDQGLKMEDEEGEMFNNTYLSDLQAGRCIESGRESVSSRISELQYRNSLCPPHLKSSYPAETQFQSPGQFKEEDLKMGTVDLDDSMSSSLLPGEKPRMKKDWGQTMYKKPGPPTPSKNGGRLSLQGNEVHPRDILREQNQNEKGPRAGGGTSTPSRIKMLFSRSGHRNDSEVGKHHHIYEHSLVPLITRPKRAQFKPQFIKVYHMPHTFSQAIRFYCSKELLHAILLMIASAFTTYFSLTYYDM